MLASYVVLLGVIGDRFRSSHVHRTRVIIVDYFDGTAIIVLHLTSEAADRASRLSVHLVSEGILD